jgi:hypothetical protein
MATQPPADVPANELFLRLLERPRPAETVDFPGLDAPGARGKIRIQVLRKEEHDRARLVSIQRLKDSARDFGISALTPDDMRDEAVRGVISDLSACEVLAMSCTTTAPMSGEDATDADAKYGRVFPDGKAVGKTLTPDEVRYLFSAYHLLQQKYGPNESLCLPEDINLWIRRLVEGAEQYPFLRLSSLQWGELLTALAKKLYTLSDLLISKWETLPESWKSELQTYCLDTGSSGVPAESSIETELPQGDISFEQAMRFANLKLGRDTGED